MRSFQHITPPLRLHYGPDGLKNLGRELERLNSRRAVVFCGGSVSRHPVMLELVRAAIGERCAGVFAGVRAHSPAPAVAEGARELKRLEADAVIAVGGGSAIVTARAASILLAERGDLASLSTSRDAKGELRSPKLLAAKLPQLIIPTTPTTAIAKAGSAVLDPEAGERRALFDPKTRAQAVFIHPDFLRSAPLALIVSASLNTLALAVEGLTARSGDPLADALLMHALRLVTRHLHSPALAEDAAVQGELVLAALLCGQGTDHTGAGMTTVLGHAIGARHAVENGITNAILLPHVLRFNADSAASGLHKIAGALDLTPFAEHSPGAAIIDSIAGVFRRLDIPSRLRDVGVPREAIADIAAHAMGDWFLRGNPRPIRDASELAQVLDDAW